MEKSLVIAVENFKNDLAKLINESGISPYFLESAIKDVYFDVRDAAIEVVKNEREIEMQKLMEQNESNVPTDPEVVSGEVVVDADVEDEK